MRRFHVCVGFHHHSAAPVLLSAVSISALFRPYLVMNPAKKTQMLSQWRPVYVTAGKFIVEACWLLQTFKRLLGIRQSVQNRVALSAVDGTVNIVGSALGNDIYDRTRVAAIFRAEVARGDLVFLNKFGIGHEQARTGDGVIVVILTVDLLVVVPPTDSIDFKARPVGIR